MPNAPFKRIDWMPGPAALAALAEAQRLRPDLGRQALIDALVVNVAGDVLTSVQTARGAMRGLGNTGWGTPTMATAANVLASLGVKDAANYAGNSQVFQQAAMERLWGTLNAAKGPQTEGDADRAAKTFASLQNTPRANEYILDLAQARAERDQMKANFFRQALPLGQRAGDLQQIEREWQTRQPSIFNMPSMRKWGQQ